MIKIRHGTPPDTFPAELAAWATARNEAYTAHFLRVLKHRGSDGTPLYGFLPEWDLDHPMPIYVPNPLNLKS